LYLVQKQQGKVRQIFVPSAWQKRVRQAVSSYQQMSSLSKKSPNWSGSVCDLKILRRLIAYAEKIFDFSDALVASLREGELYGTLTASASGRAVRTTSGQR